MTRRPDRRRRGGVARTNSDRCGKIRYTSKPAAEAAGVLRAEQNPNYPDVLRVYFCRRCDGWHLTSQPKKPPAGQ